MHCPNSPMPNASEVTDWAVCSEVCCAAPCHSSREVPWRWERGRDGQHPQVASSSPSSLWRGGDTPKLAISGVMANIRKSRHHHHNSRSRSDITRYTCCIIMLLVLFNKIRVHSYHTVLCWFLVSSLVPP